MTRTVRCRNSAGALVLDLSSAGYEVAEEGVRTGERTWVRQTATSPFVDGVHEVSKTLDGDKIEVTARVIGSTWGEVEARRQVLLAAVEASSWLLEIEVDGVSYTYRASGADSISGLTEMELRYKERTVMLTIPVQPTPAITGI